MWWKQAPERRVEQVKWHFRDLQILEAQGKPRMMQERLFEIRQIDQNEEDLEGTVEKKI